MIYMKISDIVERIAYFRTQKRLSARELSLQIGKHEGYINKLETQYFNVPVDVLLEILECLEIAPEEFFAENYKNYKLDINLYNAIKKLPLDKKNSLLSFIK